MKADNFPSFEFWSFSNQNLNAANVNVRQGLQEGRYQH